MHILPFDRSKPPTLIVGLKLAALPALAYAFFVAYTHSLPLAQSLLPAASDVGVTVFIVTIGLCAVALALVWALVFALPLALLYRRHAVLAAALCVIPLLAVVGARYFDRPFASPMAQLPTLFFVVTLIVIVPGVTHLLYRAIVVREQGVV